MIAIAAYQPDLVGVGRIRDVHLRRWDRISALGAHAQRTVGRHAVPFIHGDPRGHPLSLTLGLGLEGVPLIAAGAVMVLGLVRSGADWFLLDVTIVRASKIRSAS